MCGIAGLWAPKTAPADNLRMAKAMTGVLHRRGPDGSGYWSDEQACLVLGHRRLSVLDLSKHGGQPMVSQSGRFALSYNGEIYNFEELRRSLQGSVNFRGHSDSEVALAAIDTWGVEAAAKRFVGMFAFAVWDRQERKLLLGRDRLGIKPLYYATIDHGMLFGSQPKAFLQHPLFSKDLEPAALASYVQASCVPSPLCIFRDAKKVPPGSILSFCDATDRVPRSATYWDMRAVAVAGQEDTFRGDSNLAIERLDTILTEAVGCRLVSDVPLGAFLSGGIDSSTVVALMQKVSNQRVKTFTIGTQERSHDESANAKLIAEHLGTEHHELVATPSDALGIVADLPTYYDEPFADSSQIPTFLVSRLAREHVTVALSGDGGDELFAGYNRHMWGPRVMRWNSRIPKKLRHSLRIAVQTLQPDTWDKLYERFMPGFRSMRMQLPADKLNKLSRALDSESESELYRLLAANNALPREVLVEQSAGVPYRSSPALKDAAHRFMLRDLGGYLPNDILTKVDRASMAVGLEARVPILDHRVVEFAWSLPLSMKIREGQGKWILRQVLAKYVPARLFDQPKSGFGVPIAAWLRGPLREWAEELLDPRKLMQQGIFRPAPIRQKWQEHQSGKRDWHQHLWDMLMFQAWSEHYCS